MDQAAQAQSPTGSSQTGNAPDAALTQAEILAEEFQRLHGNQPLPGYNDSVHALKGGPDSVGQAALCLSGGGIRSAAFALGILQGLARRNVLRDLDYLSTVSGGGYMGCWLMAWIARCQGGIKAVERALSRRGTTPLPLRWIRANTAFLTPRRGVLSADLWAAIATVLRNMLLNWLVLIPLGMALVMAPLLVEGALRLAAEGGPHKGSLWAGSIGLLGLFDGTEACHLPGLPGNRRELFDIPATLFLLLALWSALASRPSLGRLPRITEPGFRRWVILPLGIAAFGFSLAMAAWFDPKCEPGLPYLVFWIVPGGLLYLLAWLLALFQARVKPGESRAPEAFAIVVEGVVVGAMVWAGDWLAHHFLGHLPREALIRPLVTFWPPWLLLSFVTGQIIYAALVSALASGEQDNEWLNRASGWYLLMGLIWLAVFVPALYGWELGASLALKLGLGTGSIALLGASSPLTKATTALSVAREKLPFSQLVNLLSVATILVFAVLLSRLGQQLLILTAPCGSLIESTPATGSLFASMGWQLDFAEGVINPCETLHLGRPYILGPFAQLLLAALWIVGLVAFSLLAGKFVKVNTFSLHGLYRNRLVRCFLGASRAEEKEQTLSRPDADAFDGFSATDNMPLHALQQVDGPLLVVNMALNLSASADHPEWQERKATAFVATPLHVGGSLVGYAKANQGEERSLTLGSAMAISGAAASPNWGYHSSRPTALLLTLFNLRLGWWLANPKKPGRWHRHGPGWSHLLAEAMMETNERDRYLYLSDGGHFDNLGLYEMLRRRCHTIIVSDATADPEYSLEDLGRSLRLAKIDFDIDVIFEPPMPFKGRGSKPGAPIEPAVYCSIGRIRYPECDKPNGLLIYIKPMLGNDVPADILAYSAGNARFPHDTTANQWFTESQFESYRALGTHALRVITDTPDDTVLVGRAPGMAPGARPSAVASPKPGLAAFRDSVLAVMEKKKAAAAQQARPAASPARP